MLLREKTNKRESHHMRGGDMGGDAASYASPSSPESCPASSEARATRTEWSRRAAHDGYIFIESETRPRR